MKQKRSMDEALSAAKELRKNLGVKPAKDETQPDAQLPDSHLKVVESAQVGKATIPTDKALPESAETECDIHASASPALNTKPIWVRHTIGLRDATSLRLRDAADGQKRKERYGQLSVHEPANEQEIADLGITLALRQLGYLDGE